MKSTYVRDVYLQIDGGCDVESARGLGRVVTREGVCA